MRSPYSSIKNKNFLIKVWFFNNNFKKKKSIFFCFLLTCTTALLLIRFPFWIGLKSARRLSLKSLQSENFVLFDSHISHPSNEFIKYALLKKKGHFVTYISFFNMTNILHLYNLTCFKAVKKVSTQNWQQFDCKTDHFFLVDCCWKFDK